MKIQPAGALALLLFFALCAGVPEAPSAAPAGGTGAEIAALLEPIRQKHDLPALAAAVVHADGRAVVGATGFRKYGDPARVTAEDQFHIGSCTKSMTATLIGMLVEEGKLRWDLTLAEAFPELKKKMR